MSPSDDPYRNYRFRVQWSGRPVAGFAEVSLLPQKLKSAGRLPAGCPPPGLGPEGQGTPFFISLERGISLDLGFAQWISMVRSFGPATGKGSLLVEYKRPVTLEVYDGNGRIVCAYHLTHCWVAEYKAVPDPGVTSHKTVIEHLRLGFEQWERDPPGDD